MPVTAILLAYTVPHFAAMSEHANRLGSYREATAFVDAAAAIRAGRSDNLKLPEGDQKP
jgi:hypothetical protein